MTRVFLSPKPAQTLAVTTPVSKRLYFRTYFNLAIYHLVLLAMNRVINIDIRESTNSKVRLFLEQWLPHQIHRALRHLHKTNCLSFIELLVKRNLQIHLNILN